MADDKNIRLVYDFPPGWTGSTAHQRASLKTKLHAVQGCRAIEDNERSDLTPRPLHFLAWIPRLGARNEANVNTRAICLTRPDRRLWQPPAAAAMTVCMMFQIKLISQAIIRFHGESLEKVLL